MSARARSWWTAVIVAVVLLLLSVGVIAVMTPPPLRPAPEPTQARTSAGSWAEISRGRYLVRAGDCMACHTAKGGQPFAGGRAVPTPFGVIYSTNITPDPATGIGKWSFDAFYRAMHHGIRRDGGRLYPAFPYPWYTKVTRDDVFAIKAYLDTLKPVRQRSPENELPWPLSMRAVMAGWNTMFFDAGTYKPRTDESTQWNRGAYLVQGLLHCAACHTPKNVVGASKEDRELFGGFAEHAYAPTLHDGMREGLGAWSVKDIVEYLKTGSNVKSSAAGPMAEVVRESTQYLNDRDLTAVAVYLKNLPADEGHAKAENKDAADHFDKIDDATMQRGHAVYQDNCEGCHMAKGAGLDRVFPPFDGSAAIMATEPDTLIQVLLQGAQIPPTDTKPTGFRMPAFDDKLSDRQIADVLTYIRNAWGNHAGAVSASKVAEKREVASKAPEPRGRSRRRSGGCVHMTSAATLRPSPMQAPVLAPGATSASVTDAVSDIVLARRAPASDTLLEQRRARAWWIALAVALALTGLFAASIFWVLLEGVGVWGLNIPVAWSFAIVNYVWWIAIGMGGTFISAALYLMRADWRAAINRYAEAMTLFAVCVSGIFPILHLGRPWFFYWLFPYPDTMDLWPQWRSSLFWDFAAILAYLLFSAMYWYCGLIPDLATLRDRARSRGKQVFYGLLALGWRGEARQWRQMERLMLLMAAMAVPLVFSVHSMVALDFSEAILPGWHSTIFPPFFVAGALHSGFAMVLLLGIPIRAGFALQTMITPRHLDNMARLILATSLVMAYCYGAEIFTAFYSGDIHEISTAQSRFTGAYAWVYWSTWVCNVLAVQVLWWPRMRRCQPVLVAVAALILVGMWLERFMLIVTSLYRGVMPSSWGMFYPTFWDIATLAGSIGLFLLLLLLFVRWLPVLSMHELRKLAHERGARS